MKPWFTLFQKLTHETSTGCPSWSRALPSHVAPMEPLLKGKASTKWSPLSAGLPGNWDEIYREMPWAQPLSGKCSLPPLSLLSNGCFLLTLAGKDGIWVLICSISLDVKKKKKRKMHAGWESLPWKSKMLWNPSFLSIIITQDTLGFGVFN